MLLFREQLKFWRPYNKNSCNQVQVQWVDFTNSHLHFDRSLTNFSACAQTVKSGRTMLLHVLWLYIFCQRNSGMKNTHSYSWQRHVTHSDMELNINVTAAVIRHRHTHTRKDICAWKERESRKASFYCLQMLKLLVAWRQRWRPDIPSNMTALWATASLSVFTPYKLHWYRNISGIYSNFQRLIRRISLFLHN